MNNDIKKRGRGRPSKKETMRVKYNAAAPQPVNTVIRRSTRIAVRMSRKKISEDIDVLLRDIPDILPVLPNNILTETDESDIVSQILLNSDELQFLCSLSFEAIDELVPPLTPMLEMGMLQNPLMVEVTPIWQDCVFDEIVDTFTFSPVPLTNICI